MEGKVKNMNTEKVVQPEAERPNSPFIPVPELIAKLSKSLPRKKISSMKKIEKGFLVKKFTRGQMAKYLRKVVGDDDLIVSCIKAYTNEVMAESMIPAFEKLNCETE